MTDSAPHAPASRGPSERSGVPDYSPLGRARRGLDACVHCGFCLQACPTYLALEDENDSPRGRLVLMRSLIDGTLQPDDPTAQTHIDRCLGCRACETACPSGVPYGELLEATRATLAPVHPLPPIGRIILWVFARPRWTAVALAFSRWLRATGIPALAARAPGRVGFAMAMLAATRVPRVSARKPAYAPPTDGARGRVALLRGCVMQGLFRETNRATERTLAANEFRVVDVPGQGCCGALHAHAGALPDALALARKNIVAFERADIDMIAVNAAGCGAMLKSYRHLLADDPAWAARAAAVSAMTRDVSEVLADAGPAAGAPIDALRIAYDPPCHLLHAQRVSAQPLAVLNAVGGVSLVPLLDADQCCGGAGIYNLIEPAVSDAVLATKIANITASGAQLVVSGNPGCLMQIGAGLRRHGSRVRAIHPIDLLDASYAARHPT